MALQPSEGDPGTGQSDHLPPTPLIIPEIQLPFAAAPPRSDSEPLRTQALAWAQRYGLIGRRGAHRLSTTALLELGVALCARAPTPRAEILVCWYLWALTLDDRIDDGPWAENGALDRFIIAVQALTESGDADPSGEISRFDDPMLVVLADDLWPRTQCLGGDHWRHRLVQHLIQHLRAQATLVRLREADRSLTLAEYLPLRRDSFGALFFFDLIDAAETLDPYEHPAHTEWWSTLREHAADMIAWTNDIHSIAKDVVCGERFNLVSILANTRGIGWPAALESAHQMVNTAVAQFTVVAARHANQRRTAATDPDRLSQVVRAAADWHRSVSRYHLQTTDASAQDNRQVDLKLTPPTLKSRQFEIDPYPLYERLRTTLPIVYDEPTDVWLVSRHVDVKAVLTQPGVSNNNYSWQIGPLLGHTIVTMDGCEHAQHRALLSPAFRSQALVALEASITSVTTDLLAHMHGRSQVDLIADFTAALPVRVMARALGLPAQTLEEVERLKRWCAVGFAYMGNYRQDPALLTGGLSNRDSFYDFIQPHIDARRAEPSDDLISQLLAARIDGQPLSETFVRSYCAILMTAGSETSHGALANLIVNLLSEPGVKEAVMANPDLMDNALTETLRRNPPLQLVLREARESLQLPSGTIPAGATLACLIGSANRDPDQFIDPDTFNMSRTEQATSHFAFGAGRHFCLGSMLARMEITISARMLLQTFPNMRWAPGFTPTERGFLNRCPEQLEVVL
ncbi:pulcherriminic acid synthase [Pseudomonas gessardii]|uniref:Cytochrome P450 n=1 Tax=Pseudomonas gessardii TaxID=78544 RepID=A0A7Y1MMS9_9PSED|nr:cytochrome P450 [Pseudomonas gessardii]MRU48794.1 cytochrome P450 [Pseudomonas gessardii]NNA95110.1 cytochrome P450 [Pseudomonas gessardii]ONH49189.1 cytochrome [Pseudomonas gessardii]SDQ57397.1 pulcherriminic acid synthase [Pseudomonas gessardii]